MYRQPSADWMVASPMLGQHPFYWYGILLRISEMHEVRMRGAPFSRVRRPPTQPIVCPEDRSQITEGARRFAGFVSWASVLRGRPTALVSGRINPAAITSHRRPLFVLVITRLLS